MRSANALYLLTYLLTVSMLLQFYLLVVLLFLLLFVVYVSAFVVNKDIDEKTENVENSFSLIRVSVCLSVSNSNAARYSHLSTHSPVNT